MEKLKPCPFCGKEGYVYEAGPSALQLKTDYYPRCRTENCVGNQGWVEFETEEKAIKAWNRWQTK